MRGCVCVGQSYASPQRNGGWNDGSGMSAQELRSVPYLFFSFIPALPLLVPGGSYFARDTRTRCLCLRLIFFSWPPMRFTKWPVGTLPGRVGSECNGTASHGVLRPQCDPSASPTQAEVEGQGRVPSAKKHIYPPAPAWLPLRALLCSPGYVMGRGT